MCVRTLSIHVGIFVTNLAARNIEMKKEFLRQLSDYFPKLLSIPIPEDVNEIIVGLPSTGTSVEPDHDFASCQEIKDMLVKFSASVSKTSVSAVKSEDLAKEWTDLLSTAKIV